MPPEQGLYAVFVCGDLRISEIVELPNWVLVYVLDSWC